MNEMSTNTEQMTCDNIGNSERLNEIHFRSNEIDESKETDLRNLEWFRNELDSDEKLSSKEVADRIHDETKEHAINEYGKYMSKEQIEGLRLDETKNLLEIVSNDEYFRRYPEEDPNVLGHCELDGRIIIIDDNSEIIRHVTTHETTHLCGNREFECTSDGDIVNRSGMREFIFTANGEFVDNNQGINEGITQMLTLDELLERGDEEAAYCMECYPEARMWAVRLEDLVGRETIAEAYYGKGQEKLVTEFNRLNYGNPSAWESFSRDIDTLTYSSDETARYNAQERLVNQFALMKFNKRGMNHE